MSPLLVYLVVAYTVVWVALFAYLLFLAGAIRGLRGEVAELRETQETQASALPSGETQVRQHVQVPARDVAAL
jgi:CcmD family protein